MKKCSNIIMKMLFPERRGRVKASPHIAIVRQILRLLILMEALRLKRIIFFGKQSLRLKLCNQVITAYVMYLRVIIGIMAERI